MLNKKFVKYWVILKIYIACKPYYTNVGVAKLRLSPS